jgi:hypothetical protein
MSELRERLLWQRDGRWGGRSRRSGSRVDEPGFIEAQYLAGQAFRRALKKGELVRGPCEVCGTTKHIDGHHDDYSKPLEVRWLCRRHHILHHWAIFKAANKPGVEA